MAPGALLRVEGLTKRFGGIYALDHVDLAIEPDEFVGMIGPNGSGKSTFVNVVTQSLRPDAGAVWFGGERLPPGAPHLAAARGIARTYQHLRLFEKHTVEHNLRVAALAHRSRLGAGELDEAVWRTLERVGLAHRASTVVERLTLYEKRLVEIGSRLVFRPRLLMLDEPAAGLSPEEIRRLIDLLRSFRGQLTLFLIEHTMRVISELVDRVVVLVEGKKIADAPPTVILRDELVIQSYLGGIDAGRTRRHR